MRILALTNLFPNPLQPHRGSFNRRQLLSLSATHDVKVIAPIAWTDELRNRGDKFGPRRQGTLEGIDVYYPRYYFPPRCLRSTYGSCLLRSIRNVVNHVLRTFTPDVIYGTWVYPDGWAAVQLGHELGLPVVLKAHGSDLLLLKNNDGKIRGTKQALAAASVVVCVSGDLAAAAERLGTEPAKLHVVYEGVDTRLFTPGDREEARRRLGRSESESILFVGNLVPGKGVDLLIDCCRQLKEMGRAIQCRIVGQGPLESHLRRRITALQLSDVVHLVGPVPHAELPDWYRSANVVVLPSFSEGLPNVLAEAAACRIPFVATHVGGIPELAESSASTLVAPGDSLALAVAVNEWLSGAKSAEWRDTPILRSLAETTDVLTELFEGARSQWRSRKLPQVDVIDA